MIDAAAPSEMPAGVGAKGNDRYKLGATGGGAGAGGCGGTGGAAGGSGGASIAVFVAYTSPPAGGSSAPLVSANLVTRAPGGTGGVGGYGGSGGGGCGGASFGIAVFNHPGSWALSYAVDNGFALPDGVASGGPGGAAGPSGAPNAGAAGADGGSANSYDVPN